ncbi:MAG: hypothetical protein ACI9CU_002165, partial [Polaribacter sp.]
PLEREIWLLKRPQDSQRWISKTLITAVTIPPEAYSILVP